MKAQPYTGICLEKVLLWYTEAYAYCVATRAGKTQANKQAFQDMCRHLEEVEPLARYLLMQGSQNQVALPLLVDASFAARLLAMTRAFAPKRRLKQFPGLGDGDPRTAELVLEYTCGMRPVEERAMDGLRRMHGLLATASFILTRAGLHPASLPEASFHLQRLLHANQVYWFQFCQLLVASYELRQAGTQRPVSAGRASQMLAAE